MFSTFQVTKLTLITIATVGFLVMLSGCEQQEAGICYNGKEAHCLLVE
jgi:hypothetical protein